jgi:integrase
VPAHKTVEKYIQEWLETTGRATLRKSTYATYSSHIRNHIVPAVGGVQLKNLSLVHVQAMLNAQYDRGLASSYIRYTKAVLSRALNDAVRENLIARNVAMLAVVPRTPKREMKVWDQAQTRQFLESIQGDRLEVLFTVALSLGLRRGELLGLSWRDVDLEKGTLLVRASLTRIEHGAELGEPKTKGSRRTIHLPRTLVSILKRHRAKQKANELRAGGDWKNTGMVFTTFVGGPMTPNNLLRDLTRLAKKAGVPRIRVHDLRHTAATLMLKSGTPVKVVSETLGHASVRVTLDLYAHVLDEQRAEVAERMDDLLWGNSPRRTSL